MNFVFRLEPGDAFFCFDLSNQIVQPVKIDGSFLRRERFRSRRENHLDSRQTHEARRQRRSMQQQRFRYFTKLFDFLFDLTSLFFLERIGAAETFGIVDGKLKSNKKTFRLKKTRVGRANRCSFSFDVRFSEFVLFDILSLFCAWKRRAATRIKIDQTNKTNEQTHRSNKINNKKTNESNKFK